jgi:hypothetical protein
MNRSAQYLLVCCLLLSALPFVAARPLLQDAGAVITDPKPNATVRGLVAITGSASIGNFQFYKVEWGRGANPDEWHLIGSTYPTPVSDGVLVQWDTTTLPDGVYSLRLHVVKTDGNYSEYVVPQVIVTNKRPTETPTATPKPEETRGPTPTSGPTATLAILQPTAALARPSPTPTPVRPSPRDALPQLPVSMWRQALCMGVGAMAAISAVLGMVFGLRRLL